MSSPLRGASSRPAVQRSLEAEQLQREVERTEQRKCVTTILESGPFRDQLEGVMEGILDGSHLSVRRTALRRLEDSVLPAVALQNRSPATTGLFPRGNDYTTVIPIDDLRSHSHAYSRHESVVRRKLAALYRLVDWLGWSQAIYNHITVRVV